MICLQTQTTLTWIATTKGKVAFVGEKKTTWEAYLRDKYGNIVTDEHLQPEFVKIELRDCAAYLEEGQLKLLENMKKNERLFEF